MALLMICPRCLAKIPLTSRLCPRCGAFLLDLSASERHYFISPAGSMETFPSEPAMTCSEPEGTSVLDWLEPHMETTEASRLTTPLPADKNVSLCEALDRILHKGAVLFGEVKISVADIDLVYLGLQVIVSSIETARGMQTGPTEECLGLDLFDH
ncbi:gas vesicle protein GvpJ [Desulfobacca acetoxidans]|uniref:Gas vesicle protein GVPa n=1 Tax=Desulfobacca acetoxidans (strain ATCC 700848 / DSM 11109 / ASRB2) TaxID=880072 RepID=F2NHZ4_DESAR|nr:gas vesicle protein GvpJ [Desulfobacca acetoxidans]AEB09620.1 gas vesicle protein GVPa [Desulfobacca acetoxidans DSM 11109]